MYLSSGKNIENLVFPFEIPSNLLRLHVVILNKEINYLTAY